MVSLIRGLLLIESAMYAVVTPMLPHFARVLGASRPALGVLAAAYTTGLIPGSILGGILAVRIGVRRTTLVGAIVFAIAVPAFGFASHLPALDAIRAIQGVACGFVWGGALTWAIALAPEGRRGEMIGTTISAAIVGTLIGPALGVAAVTIGGRIVFGLVGAAVFVGAIMVSRCDEPPHHHETGTQPIRALLRSRRAVLGAGLTMLEATAYGAISVLVPLRLARLGASSAEVGAIFVLSSALSMFTYPAIGRFCDRRGVVLPIALALLTSAALLAGLALAASALMLGIVTILLTGIPLSGYLVPAASMLTDSAQTAGIALGFSTMLFNLAFALGQTVGSPSAAVLSRASSDTVPLLLLVALMLLTLAELVRSRRRLEAETVASPPSAARAAPSAEPPAR